MASGCKSAIGCVDAQVPVRSSYVNLHKWAESDAEFVKAVIAADKNPRKWGQARPRVVDSYSCRQMYLRSYTFSKKESVPEKTRKCLGKVKGKAAEFPFIAHQRGESSSKTKNYNNNNNNNNNKSCVGVKKIKEVTCTAISSFFRRLLISCTASVDVVDHRHSPP